jgi:hypothetical protein
MLRDIARDFSSNAATLTDWITGHNRWSNAEATEKLGARSLDGDVPAATVDG